MIDDSWTSPSIDFLHWSVCLDYGVDDDEVVFHRRLLSNCVWNDEDSVTQSHRGDGDASDDDDG